MLRLGLAVGALFAATGCAAVVSSVPGLLKAPPRLSVINLKTVESTVDKSLQDTVAISFVPPKAMAIDTIEYRVDGESKAIGEFDLVLETARLPVGDHTINLYAKGDASIVRGNTQLTVIESGKVPVSGDDASSALSGGPGNGQLAPTETSPGTYKAKVPTATAPGATMAGGGTGEAKARVSIRIRLPDE